MKTFAVYMLASGRNGTLYVGVTSDLVGQHRWRAGGGFTARYGVDRPVWFELHQSAESAIRRERQIKDWRRAWKIRLIEAGNPNWTDLYSALVR